jgi:hypothetical protein
LRLSILRHIDDPEPSRGLRTPDSRRPAEYFDSSRNVWAEPDDRARELRASRPYESGETDDLALAHGQGDL